MRRDPQPVDRAPAPLHPAPGVAAYEREAQERALAAYRHHRGTRRRLEAGLAADLSTYLPHLLNRQDKATMKASIETRVPFLDPDVVGLAMNLPLEHRVEASHKGILRDLAERRLPEGVSRRPKLGFGFDAGRYIAEAARPEFLADGRLREVLGAPAERWRERAAAARGWEAQLLWTGEIWCRLMLDGQSSGEVDEALWQPAGRPLIRS
jgi:asparagine synthase (glutamine-hydrolysing)